MCIKSKFIEICLNLATNGRSDKGFLFTSKVFPQGFFCPCPGAIYMYKIVKICIKADFEEIILKRGIWAKRKGLSVVIKCLSPMGCLPLPGAIYIWKIKDIKTVKKSEFKEIFFKLATNGQSSSIGVSIGVNKNCITLRNGRHLG